jgi:acyl-CoA thioesterase FadM
MIGDSRTVRIAMQRIDREGLILFLEIKTANMIQTAIIAETGLVVAEMSPGSKTEITEIIMRIFL